MPEDKARRNARQAAYMRARRAAGIAPRLLVDAECPACGSTRQVRPECVGLMCGRCQRVGAALVAAELTRLPPDERARRERDRRHTVKAVRRMRLKVALVEPFRRLDIFERDEWQCRLCDRPLARSEVVPHPDAPTIDHVIPIARGGAHASWNVQAAHFLCNSRKSDRVTEGVS